MDSDPPGATVPDVESPSCTWYVIVVVVVLPATSTAVTSYECDPADEVSSGAPSATSPSHDPIPDPSGSSLHV